MSSEGEQPVKLISSDNVEIVIGPRFSELRKKFPTTVEVAEPLQVCVPIEATPEVP